VERALEPASFGQRAAGWLIDQAILFGAVLLAVIPVGLMTPEATYFNPNPSPPVLLVLLCLGVMAGAMVAYPILMEGSPSGQTLGKRAMGIRVVRERDGQPIGYGHAVGRWAAQIANVFGIGLLWAAWDPKGQTLRDKLAGTLVVRNAPKPEAVWAQALVSANARILGSAPTPKAMAASPSGSANERIWGPELPTAATAQSGGQPPKRMWLILVVPLVILAGLLIIFAATSSSGDSFTDGVTVVDDSGTFILDSTTVTLLGQCVVFDADKVEGLVSCDGSYDAQIVHVAPTAESCISSMDSYYQRESGDVLCFNEQI
jgi:uncharacterized RDD family membrane protein YckC